MYEAAFKSIDDTLWKDAGCGTELDYIEQTSWVLFLKYLDDYETEKAAAAKLDNRKYRRILNKEFSWKSWATPLTKESQLDINAALTGDDLRDWVNNKLFPYLAGFKQTTAHPDTIRYEIGEIFSELRNKLQSGYALRDVINKVNELSFRSDDDKHELSSLYEDKIRKMGHAGRNGGAYYTPRPLIKAIVQIVNPRIGETVYDGALGSAGFLCEACDHMKNSKRRLSAADYNTLQSKTFHGKEKESFAYMIGTMNMILHGIELPNIRHTNTLAENIADIRQKDKMDVVLAHPPFGGKERTEIQQNFSIKTSETAYLFLQHFIKMLKAGGRAGVVMKNTFLSNTDNVSVALRKQLLEDCNLYTILDAPAGTFTGSGVKTVVLFFEKGRPTKRIWYYQFNVGRNLDKTNPLNNNDMQDFVQCARKRDITDNSWVVDIADVSKDTWTLTARNPNRADSADNRPPAKIIAEIERLDTQAKKR